jgi:hypothetical protein
MAETTTQWSIGLIVALAEFSAGVIARRSEAQSSLHHHLISLHLSHFAILSPAIFVESL